MRLISLRDCNIFKHPINEWKYNHPPIGVSNVFGSERPRIRYAKPGGTSFGRTHKRRFMLDFVFNWVDILGNLMSSYRSPWLIDAWLFRITFGTITGAKMQKKTPTKYLTSAKCDQPESMHVQSLSNYAFLFIVMWCDILVWVKKYDALWWDIS